MSISVLSLGWVLNDLLLVHPATPEDFSRWVLRSVVLGGATPTGAEAFRHGPVD
jgi:hypothetical protein